MNSTFAYGGGALHPVSLERSERQDVVTSLDARRGLRMRLLDPVLLHTTQMRHHTAGMQEHKNWRASFIASSSNNAHAPPALLNLGGRPR